MSYKLLYRLYVLCLLLGTLLFVPTATAVKIGVLAVYHDKTDITGFMSLHTQGSAINIAYDKLIADGVLNNETFSVVWPELDSFTQSDGVGNVVDLVRHENVDVIFGSPSSRVSVPVAHMTTHWNLPQITWAAQSYELSNKTRFQTLVRTAGPISEVGGALVTLCKAMNWQKIGFMYIDYGICSYTAHGTRSEIAKNNLTEIQTVSYTQDTVITDAMIDKYLRQLRRTSRIIFICVNDLLRRFLIRACRYNNMCNGEFLFLTTGLSNPTESLWSYGDSDDSEAKRAFKFLFYASVAKYVGDDGKEALERFEAEVIERMSEKPWYSDEAKRNNVKTHRLGQYLYDGTYFYGLWLNHSRQHGLDIRDGRAMMAFTKDLSFPGIAGSCDFGKNGDRIPNMWIFQFINGTPEIVAIAETKRNAIKEMTGFHWFTADNLPPVDTPRCGYFNEFCVEDPEKENNTTLLAILLTVLVVVMVTAGTGLTIRKRQIENAMIQSIWKVNINELELINYDVGGGSRFNLRSQAALSRASQQSGPEKKSECQTDWMLMRRRVTRRLIWIQTVCKVVNNPAQAKVGTLRGQEVVIRSVSKTATTVLSRDDMIQLKTMRQLVHDNINPFVGATFDVASPCVMFLFCRKGSLQDILENDDITLDSLFKFSMLMDVIRGMTYIHSSKLNCHGRLKSSNCLVDGRWVVKVTDYGTGRFLDNTGTDRRGENEIYKSLLWAAPELLADQRSLGTKEGDVYSFAIIMHEIFYRQGTFAGKSYMTAKDIIEKVLNREPTPCRPEIFNDVTDVPPHVIKLMKMCWSEAENERPNFKMIRNYFKDNMKNRNTNIIDAVLQRLEKYAANLEDVVEQRTHQLMQEKKKADKLLYRMLPP